VRATEEPDLIPSDRAPAWLWRTASWGLLVAILAVLGLAVALALGLADPPRAGPLLWQDDFKRGTAPWDLHPPAGGTLAAADGALLAGFGAAAGAEPWAVGLTAAPAGDFTLEVAAAAVQGENVAAYGLLYDWQDDQHYSALFMDGNGYAEAYHQAGAERVTLFQWQQWPNILFGADANRVRVDVRGQSLILRINDELLVTGARAKARGQLGLAARSPAAARVVFSWVRVWASS
jgi:hypothetical protein